ncbi:glycosyl hydrolase family 8 [Carboxylicivirga sp. RSCT41]|uniref:glycosyl hydrolase family 8 n=1 Tax=Carboxylicivirga agarovorans TaxID=3417570 RepID=UPI003D33695B
MRYLLLIAFISFSLYSCEGNDHEKRPEQRKEFVHAPLEALKPFPQAIAFNNCIKPNHISQGQMNQDIIDYYYHWLRSYVRESNGTTPGGGYYVKMLGTGGDGNEITTSEAHGYGMIIFALMAGRIADAQKYFDGMLNMFDKHRSTGNPECMSWLIHKTEESRYDKGSATDGDMDIAYALLLADKQWGSEGAINYLEKARTMISKGVRQSDMSSISKRSMLGDWDTNNYSSRSSDWMTAHFRSYHAATSDEFWLAAADEVYQLIDALSTNYSSTTGLMPDFIVNKSPRPATEYYLDEYKETDEYSWNACRYPWRISTDYAHFGTADAKRVMMKLQDFIIASSDGEPSDIKAGYYLDGRPINSYSSNAFTAPFVAASIVDPKYQVFLNKGWDVIKAEKESYYGDTIGLLNMLLISGNWWNPAE